MPQTGPVRIWLLSDTRKVLVLVLVWDANSQPPALTDADEYAESGRGLFLVQAFSERWGTYPTPQIGGKVAWGANTGEFRADATSRLMQLYRVQPSRLNAS